MLAITESIAERAGSLRGKHPGRGIQKELGFVPQYDLKAGWEETIREMRGKDRFTCYILATHAITVAL